MQAELTRQGPGLLLRDIARGDDPQLLALKAIVDESHPDILVLTRVDYDAENRTLRALRDFLQFPYAFAHPPNSMQLVDVDLNGDGISADRHVWARFAGHGAIAVLSRYPVSLRFQSNDLLWKDVPWGALPKTQKGLPYPSSRALDHQKLVGQGFWVLRAQTLGPNPGRQSGTPMRQRAPTAMDLVVFHNQSPVFDGPEDTNGLRNAAQLGLILDALTATGAKALSCNFAIMGNTNLDPQAGEGDRAAMQKLLAHPSIVDPLQKDVQGEGHTVVFERSGALRTTYLLPSRSMEIGAAGVLPPSKQSKQSKQLRASRHRLVWTDVYPNPECGKLEPG